MALAAEVAEARSAGVVVLCEDETILREFPPLPAAACRACWGKRGQAVEVPVSGSNARRVVFGALNPFTGARLCMTARRSGGPEFRDFLRRLRARYKRWDLLLVLDRGSCHTAKATLALAAALRITLAWLPTACPELNPVEALWRDATQHVSANRAHADIDAHAADFAAHVRGHTNRTALRLSGLSSGNFWLTT